MLYWLPYKANSQNHHPCALTPPSSLRSATSPNDGRLSLLNGLNSFPVIDTLPRFYPETSTVLCLTGPREVPSLRGVFGSLCAHIPCRFRLPYQGRCRTCEAEGLSCLSTISRLTNPEYTILSEAGFNPCRQYREALKSAHIVFYSYCHGYAIYNMFLINQLSATA